MWQLLYLCISNMQGMIKKTILFSAMVALLNCGPQQNMQAQTWTVGSTTLTESDVVTGLDVPWEILWGPDDFIWATTRSGAVIHIEPSTGNYTTILDLTNVVPDEGSSEPGLLGMVLHPDFANSPLVYLVYNYMVGNSIKERLVSYDWNGTALVNETILLNTIPGYWIHNGSRLVITPDQKILMSTGDTGDGGDSSQDFAALNGKVLRINLDGSIPSDNPVLNDGDAPGYAYSWGHRNIQGLCIAPDGTIYSSEHGQNNNDEFNIIEPGRNYGWPNVEGVCNTAAEQTFCTANNVKEPIRTWSPCVAVNGIEYYNHPAIPEWNHCILMGVLGGLSGANGNNDRVSVLHLSPDGLTIESEDQYFTTLNQRFRDICVNPYTGSLYVALNGTSYPGSGPNKIKEFRNMAYNSVTRFNETQALRVFPNPASDELQLQVSQTLVGQTVSIFGANGDLVREIKVSAPTQQIAINDLAPGAYWLKSSSSLGTVTATFMKQ
jgi:aldose sugar dehydrogenase